MTKKSGSMPCMTILMLSATLLPGCAKEPSPVKTSQPINATSAGKELAQPLPDTPSASVPKKDEIPTASKAPASRSSAGADDVPLEPASPADLKTTIAHRKGHVVLVYFWATTNAAARDQLSKAMAIDKKYRDQGVRIVLYSLDQRSKQVDDEILKILNSQQATFTTNLVNDLDDPKVAMEQLKLKAGVLPQYQIFDKQGRPAALFSGDGKSPFPEQEIENAIEAALKDE